MIQLGESGCFEVKWYLLSTAHFLLAGDAVCRRFSEIDAALLVVVVTATLWEIIRFKLSCYLFLEPCLVEVMEVTQLS